MCRKKDGLSWPTAHVAGSYSVPVPAGTTGKELSDNGTLTLAQVHSEKDSVNAVLARTNKIIGVVLHPRQWAWPRGQYSPDEFSSVQTSSFADPLKNFLFRLMIYHMPNLQQYHMVCSAKFGFTPIDFRAATLLLGRAVKNENQH